MPDTPASPDPNDARNPDRPEDASPEADTPEADTPEADTPEADTPEANRPSSLGAGPGAGPGAGADESPEPIDMLQPLFREESLRPEGAEAPPMWLWMVIFGTLLFGTYYLGNYIGDFSPNPWLQSPDPVAEATAPSAAEATVSGANIYSSRCASCHQANGQGVSGAFPPLIRTPWVEDKGQIIRILLHGMQGEMEVDGEVYNGAMPAWGSTLSDREIAAVITHVRQSWDNDYSDVTADEVAGVRGATEGRASPWTAEELAEDANQTVPSTEEGGAAAGEPAASNGTPLGPRLYAAIVMPAEAR
jgi:mono/diheme cytochrome c family protein